MCIYYQYQIDTIDPPSTNPIIVKTNYGQGHFQKSLLGLVGDVFRSFLKLPKVVYNFFCVLYPLLCLLTAHTMLVGEGVV